MKKLLSLISSIIFTTTSISNLSYATNYFNVNVLKQNKFGITNSNQDDLTKLENWHNSLSIEQDAQAKQDYLDAMQITTIKSTTSNLDTYNINFDNSKLQAMLKNELLNQDAYNIIINKNTSIRLTNEANAFVNLPTKNNVNIKVRAFQSNFYIENNKMHFVDKDHLNPYQIDITKLNIYYHKNVNPFKFEGTAFFSEIDEWFLFGFITVEEHEVMITEVDGWFFEGYDIAETISKLTELILEIIADEITSQWLITLLSVFLLPLFTSNKTSMLQEIVNNFSKIKSVDSKYHMGVYENFYFYGLYMDPNSITAVPPMTKSSEINDKLKANSTKRDEIITYEYDNVPLLDYNGYDSLWQYLNTKNKTFNLNKIFQSYVGILGQYNNWNYTFHHLEATAILKPYLNTWITVTKASWTNNNSETSLAQMQMMITDNPWTKTVEFNFKSILCNINAYDSVGNEMYY